MFHLVIWFAIYIVLLYLLGRVVQPWRERAWFKALFFPGLVLAALIQAGPAVLCLGGTCRISPLAGGRPTFAIDDSRAPCLAGALFILLSHFLFYVAFLIGVTDLEARGLLNAHLVSLPDIYAHQVLEGRIAVDARRYLGGLGDLWASAWRRPLPFLFTLYICAGGFACLRVRGRECRWGGIVLLVIWGLVCLAESFGLGFPFLSRGWWASLFRFPVWWVLFSYYFTMAALSLCLFALPGAVSALRKALRLRRSEDGSPEKQAPGRVTVSA